MGDLEVRFIHFEGQKLLWTCACVVLVQTNHIIEFKYSIWNENKDLSTIFDWQLHTALCRNRLTMLNNRLITSTVRLNVAVKYPYIAAFTKHTKRFSSDRHGTRDYFIWIQVPSPRQVQNLTRLSHWNIIVFSSYKQNCGNWSKLHGT